jgi:hypothetical protein
LQLAAGVVCKKQCFAANREEDEDVVVVEPTSKLFHVRAGSPANQIHPIYASSSKTMTPVVMPSSSRRYSLTRADSINEVQDSPVTARDIHVSDGHVFLVKEC